jgi:FtsZ-interacting cell division protein YlmF
VMSLAAWGPTLVMVCAVLLAGVISLRFTGGKLRVSTSDFPISEKESAALLTALREAESINAYRAHMPIDPTIHLSPIARIAPATYQDGVKEIPRHFGEGHVVSVDLGRLTASHATRLVYFCSGYLVGTRGWLFRAADRVIVLTPTGRNISDAT